jgi:hypothetical protein
MEIVQHGKPVPDGAGRHGTVHVRLTGGGAVPGVEGILLELSAWSLG